jgi:hypothetical protein
MANYRYNELDSDDDFSHTETPTLHTSLAGDGGDEGTHVAPGRNYVGFSPSLLGGAANAEDLATHSIPPPTHPPPPLVNYDELDEECAWGLSNPLVGEPHLPSAYMDPSWSAPSTAWGHSTGSGVSSCTLTGHSNGWGADMNSCPSLNPTPAPRRTVSEMTRVMSDLEIPPAPRRAVSEAVVLDEATRVSEMTRVMSDLELPPAHESRWSLPPARAARSTPPKNSSTEIHGAIHYNSLDTGPTRLTRRNADCGTTYRATPIESHTKTDMPNSPVMLTSLDGESYLSLPRVFKHLTLGGGLSEVDLCSLGEYILEEYRHIAGRGNPVFGNDWRETEVFEEASVPYSRPKIRIEKWNPRDGCMKEISIRHYTWSDYNQVAKLCLDWWKSNPTLVVY